MKQSIAVAFAAALLVSGAVSTPCDAQGAQFGMYLGTSVARFQEAGSALLELGELGVTRKRRVGVQAGAWMQRPLFSVISVQPELHYVQKGAVYSTSFADDAEEFSGDVSIGLSYIEVPVLLRMNLGGAGSGLRPFLLAGPTVAYNSRCTIGFATTGFSFSGDCEDGEEGDDIGIRALDVGATVGGGLAFNAAGRNFSLGVRLTQGLTSIAPDSDGTKNQNISVLFGIGF